MAVPRPGECLIILVLVIAVYTVYGFRIRDALPSINTERSGTCAGHAKCTLDGSKTETWSSQTTGGKRRFETIGSESARGRVSRKINDEPPAVDDPSEEIVSSSVDEDGRLVGSEASSLGNIDRRYGGEEARVKFTRVKVDADEDQEDDERDLVEEEDENDDDDSVEDSDEDDDGVEITNGDEDEDEDSAEVIDADDDEDELEVSKDDDNEDVSEDNGSETETKDDETIEDDANDDKSLLRKLDKGQDDGSSKDVKSSAQGSMKITKMKKLDDDDEEMDRTKDIRSKQRVRESAATRKFEESSKKKILKRIEAEKSDDNGGQAHAVITKVTKVTKVDQGHEDDDDEDDDDDVEVETIATQPAVRKLEKVRMADKEKSKSMETHRKRAVSESEKLVNVKASATGLDETRTVKKKDDGAGRSTKLNAEIHQSKVSTKPETNVKTDVSSVSTKIPPLNLKSETTKKPTTMDNAKTEKDEKVIVTRKKADGRKSEVAAKKSEGSSIKTETDVKGSDNKKMDADSGSDKKSSSKPKKHVDSTISLTQLNDALLRLPAFVPNFTAVEDPVCQQQGKIFLRQLRGHKLWALQMLDSSAKIPSGLLRGNFNQLGDYDQCLAVTARVKVDDKTVKVQGKYCLATLDVYASIPDMKIPVNFMQSRGFIRATMRDTGHFIPRFTTANWAVCIPAVCSAKDAENAIVDALSRVNITTGLRFSIDVDPDMCYVRQKTQSYTKETIGVLYFYAMIICVVIVATARDLIFSPQEKGNYSERIIMSFSLRRTLRILTKEEENKSAGEINCIHGIRSLATIALYVAHKMIPTAQIPYANRISLTEMANNPMSSLLRTSLAYTDCFLLLSGLLTAFNMARESTKKGEIRWFCRLVARFIRLTPSLLVMVFWYAYVMEHIGSGPQWHRAIAMNAELCKQNSWTNFLYIQNFFPFEEMCATHTHQLALDMQLSLIAPILVFFLTLKPIIGILVLFFVLQVSATFRYFATTNNNLSLVIYHGMTTKQLYKTANLTYALPLHRATPYVFGVGLGVLLHYTGKNVRIYRIFVMFGWTIATLLGAWSLFSPWHMARRDYVYDVEEAAHYAVIAPVAWSIALCWIIFACFTDHGGVVNKFLSSYWMVLFSRISYAVYISQFAVFFYNVGTTRYSGELQLHRFIDPYEAIAVTLVSVVITLLIDIPMQEVKNVIMESTDGLKSPIGAKEATEEAPSTEEKTTMMRAEISPEGREATDERIEEMDQSRSWIKRDEATNGFRRLEDSDGEEYLERWRPRSKSKEGSYARRDRYEEDEEEPEEDEEELDEEEERPTEWSWVRETRSRVAVEDDGLLEHRRSRSSQRGSQAEPEVRQSSAQRYQNDEDSRHERRSLSRQRDRIPGQSPRSSVKRERSTSRAPETGIASGRRSARLESRGSSKSRDQESCRRSPRRDRSASRTSESKMMEDEDVQRQYSRPPSRTSFSGRDQDRTLSWEATRHERSPSRAPTTPRRDATSLLSSGSEEESPKHQEALRLAKSAKRQQPVEPKISDEEDWEEELRIRRKKFMERLASEDRDARIDEGNDGWNSVKRRSSAEGKLALLKDPTGSNVMDSWTVSRGPRVFLLGSSQETEDDSRKEQPSIIQRETSLKEDERSEEESSQERSRRRSYTSGSQVTSLEEEEDASLADNDFVLKEASKRITVMDLSRLSQQEEPLQTGRTEEEQGERPIMATLKLFKRESIVKSQASEEDPEYLLPERPKLQEQEQDHPFKKAWQLQKSRSEEDPTPYALKEVKTIQESAKPRAKPIDDKRDEDSTKGDPQAILVKPRGKPSDEKRDEDSTKGGPQSILVNSHDFDLTWHNRCFDLEDRRSSSKSITDDSTKPEALSDDERFDLHKLRRKRPMDEAEWQLEET